VAPPPPIQVSTHPGLTTLSEIPSSLSSTGALLDQLLKACWNPCWWNLMDKVHLDRPRHMTQFDADSSVDTLMTSPPVILRRGVNAVAPRIGP